VLILKIQKSKYLIENLFSFSDKEKTPLKMRLDLARFFQKFVLLLTAKRWHLMRVEGVKGLIQTIRQEVHRNASLKFAHLNSIN
jgi:hypothetical protein